MTIKSMTGFGRHEGETDSPLGPVHWVWEARSVNGKNLDIRLRLPQSLEFLEQAVKKQAQAVCTRGNVSINLALRNAPDVVVPVINDEVLAIYLTAGRQLVEQGDAVVPSAADLLALRGVLDYQDTRTEYAEIPGFEAAVLDSLSQALADLLSAREAEGQALEGVLSGCLDDMAALIIAAQKQDVIRLEHRKLKVKEQLALLLDSGAEMHEDRLAQELAHMAVKADVSEELDRLAVHTASARTMLESEGPVGRRLDFLCQEFNREANTLCSKSGDAELTAIGLDLKTLIDRLREQVQNVE